MNFHFNNKLLSEKEKDKQNEEEKEMVQLVIFMLGKEEYALEIKELREIVNMKPITPIPNAVDFISGVINLRGEIVVVIDLEKRFGIQREVSQNLRRQIIITEFNNASFGIIVDKVIEVIKIPIDTIKKTSDFVLDRKVYGDYLKGVSVFNDRLILLLSLEKVLSHKQLFEVKGNIKQAIKYESKNQQKEN
jgi:purine-binding chemotaxis protein CheW